MQDQSSYKKKGIHIFLDVMKIFKLHKYKNVDICGKGYYIIDGYMTLETFKGILMD